MEQNECLLHLKLFIEEFIEMKPWAIQMFDASAKLQTGILSGNILHVGHFDECLKINEIINKTSTIKGQYCSVVFSPHEKYGQELIPIFNNGITKVENDSFITALKKSYGFCLPASCSAQNLQNIANFLEERIKSKIHLIFHKEFCHVDQTKPLTNSVIAAIAIFSFFGIIITFSTLYDILIHEKVKGNPTTALLTAFSFYTNLKNLFHIRSAENNLNCLNGIRVISLMWIILAHRFMYTFYVPLINFVDVLEWKDNLENSYVFGASMAVDTFFTVSGLLVVYVFFTNRAKGLKISLPMFYIHRIFRLTPSLAMIVLFSATLIEFIGSGPLWPVVVDFIQNPCEKNWWSTLIYLQNYINPDEECVGQAWYLAVDTQLYFLSPLILYPLIKYQKFTIFTIVSVAFLSCAYIFEITIKKKLGSVFFDLNQENFSTLYSPTHARLSPWLIGAICGYIIFKYKDKSVRLGKLTVIILWVLSLGILLAIVLSYTILIRNEYDEIDSAIFNALNRPFWAFALSVIIVLCVKGYGGYINSFLSCRIFNFLIRVNYNIYLLHLIVIIFFVGQGRNPTYFNNLFVFHNFWGDYIFTVLVSVIWTLAFESPFIILEKIIFTRNQMHKSKIVNENVADAEIIRNGRNGRYLDMDSNNSATIKINSA